MKITNVLLGVIAALLLWCGFSLHHIASRTIAAADFMAVKGDNEKIQKLATMRQQAIVDGSVEINSQFNPVRVHISQ